MKRCFYFVRREPAHADFGQCGSTNLQWVLRRHGKGWDGKYEAWFYSRALAKRVAAALNKQEKKP